MPNWCDNTLYLTHDDPEMIKKAKDAWETGKFLGTLVPEPDYKTVQVKPTFDNSHITGKPVAEFVDPEQAWWDWRIQNWGTKWDIGYDDDRSNHAQGGDNDMFVYFDSAWSPPTDAYAKLCELGFRVKGYYFETGMAFCGAWIDGVEDFYNIEEYSSKWVQENIPRYIDDEMGVSDQMELDEECE
jgi:hypothetical protein